MMLPVLFISHGSPNLMIENNETTKFLENLSSNFEKPKYILVISAHWVCNNLRILYEDNPNLIYDFYNFPKELYEIKYNAKSDLKKCDEIVELFEKNSISIEKDLARGGYDHGVYAPLKFLYPKADIPVIQISIPMYANQYEIFKIGEVLSALRDDTLILASGSITHNLYNLDRFNPNPKTDKYTQLFYDWLINNLENGNYKELLNFVNNAPYLRENHPSLEHFLPLFVALGSSKSRFGKSLHNRFMYGNLSMDTIIFKD